MPTPSLFIMGTLDLIGALAMLGIPAKESVAMLSHSVPYSLALYLGIALLIKGIYSLIFAFMGKGI